MILSLPGVKLAARRFAALTTIRRWSQSLSFTQARSLSSSPHYEGFFPHISCSSHHLTRNRYGTTVLCIRKNDKVVLASDGQVTQSNMCLKPNARKLRRLGGNKVIVGFAGSTADAFTLLERLETKLDEHPGQLLRSCVELAKMWRTDRYLRNLEAAMVVADESLSLEVIGNGDVLESHDGIIGIGSGGGYAMAAARALYDLPNLDAREIAERSMKVAADLCIYTNHNFIFEELQSTIVTKSEELSDQNDLNKPVLTTSDVSEKNNDSNKSAPESVPSLVTDK